MGLWDQMRERLRPRTEASYRIAPDILDSKLKTSPPTFVPEMILEEVWDRDNLDHLQKVAKQDPIAARIVHMIPQQVFDDWFVIQDLKGEEHPQNKQIQEDFERIRAKHYFTMALAGEFNYGHTWLQVILENKESLDKRIDLVGSELKEGIKPRLAGLDFWTPLDAEVWTFDSVGAPKEIEIKYEKGVGIQTTEQVKEIISAKDMVLWRTRPHDRSFAGRSILDPVWDSLVYLRFLFHAVTWYAMKLGLGAFFVKVRKLTEETKAAVEGMMKDVSVKRNLLFDNRIEDLGFLGAAGSAVNFDAYINSILDEIAVGTGIPKNILTGEDSGHIAAGQSDDLSFYAYISKLQMSVEPYVREVIAKGNYDMGEGYKVSWNTRFAHNEMDKAQIEVSHVSAQVARLGYMTMNEVRALDKLDSIEGGDETPAPKDDFRIGVSGMQGPQDQQNEKDAGNKEDKQI